MTFIYGYKVNCDGIFINLSVTIQGFASVQEIFLRLDLCCSDFGCAALIAEIFSEQNLDLPMFCSQKDGMSHKL